MWNYGLQPTFFLGMLNFDLRHLEPEKADPSRFIHKFSLYEDETYELMSRSLRFAFLEVSRFNKSKEECRDFEDKFLYVMKNLPTFALEPDLWDDKDTYFNSLMEEAAFANMTFEEQERYIASMKQKWDYKNTLDFARSEGREAGFSEGREEERISNAKALILNGVSMEIISKSLGIPIADLQRL